MALPARRILPEPAPVASAVPIGRTAFTEDDPLFLGLLLVNSLAAAAFILVVHTVVLPPEPVDDAAVQRLLKDLPRVDLPRPVAFTIDEISEDPIVPPSPVPRPEPARAAPAPDVAPEEQLAARFAAIDEAARGIERLGSAGDVLVELAGATPVPEEVGGIAPAYVAGTVPRFIGDAPVDLQHVGGGTAETGDAKVPLPKPVLQPQAPETPANLVDGIQSAVAGQRRALETCVERALHLNPTLSGRVSFGFVIRAGRVGDIDVRDSSGDDQLDGCMAQSLGRLRFPSTVDGEVESYTFIVSGR